MGVKSGQVWRFLIKVDAPEATFVSWLVEGVGTIESLRNFIEGWGLVMLSNYRLVEVSGIDAYKEGTILLLGICEGRYPFSQLGDCGNDTEGDHVVEGLLYAVSVLNGYLLLGVQDRGNEWVGTDGVSAWHVFYGIKGERGGTHEGQYVMGCHCKKRGWLRCVWASLPGHWSLQHWLECCWAPGWEGDSSWVDYKGLLKVNVFFNFFLSITVTTLMGVPGASLVNLNSSIFSQSEAACNIRIWGLVSSLKM